MFEEKAYEVKRKYVEWDHNKVTGKVTDVNYVLDVVSNGSPRLIMTTVDIFNRHRIGDQGVIVEKRGYSNVKMYEPIHEK